MDGKSCSDRIELDLLLWRTLRLLNRETRSRYHRFLPCRPSYIPTEPNPQFNPKTTVFCPPALQVQHFLSFRCKCGFTNCHILYLDFLNVYLAFNTRNHPVVALAPNAVALMMWEVNPESKSKVIPCSASHSGLPMMTPLMYSFSLFKGGRAMTAVAIAVLPPRNGPPPNSGHSYALHAPVYIAV